MRDRKGFAGLHARRSACPVENVSIGKQRRHLVCLPFSAAHLWSTPRNRPPSAAISCPLPCKACPDCVQETSGTALHAGTWARAPGSPRECPLTKGPTTLAPDVHCRCFV